MPPLHHGQPGDDGDPRDPRHRPGAGLGPGLRSAWTFVGVMFTCALIVFWTLRGLGDLSLPAALGVLALAAVAAAVITRYVRRR